MSTIEQSCKDNKLQGTQSFKDKIIQLYDTTRVRHGLMIVGPTGGGKTKCYKTLAHALSAMAANGDPE